MEINNTEDIKIANTTKGDLDTIFWLFEQAMELQGKNGYKVWEGIDKIALQKDIDEGSTHASQSN